MTRLRYALLGVATVVVGTALAIADASAEQTTSTLPDGRHVTTQTTRNGSTCTVFSKTGAVMCSRSIPTTDHRAAIARCLAIKC